MTIYVQPAFCQAPLTPIGAVRRHEVKGSRIVVFSLWKVVLFLLVLVVDPKVIESFFFFFAFRTHTLLYSYIEIVIR